MGQICFILGNRFLIIYSNFESAITQKLSELSGEDLQLRDQRSLTGIMALDLEENLFEKFDLSKIIAPIKGVFRLFVETIKFAPIRITTAL